MLLKCSIVHCTQASQRKKRIMKNNYKCHVVINRIMRLLDSIATAKYSNQATLQPSFQEGLCRVLSGLNEVATTRNVISSSMPHLTSSTDGS